MAAAANAAGRRRRRRLPPETAAAAAAEMAAEAAAAEAAAAAAAAAFAASAAGWRGGHSGFAAGAEPAGGVPATLARERAGRPAGPMADTGTIPHHLRNAFQGAPGDRRPDAGDGCKMWFVNSWALGWSRDL
jgi:hypothetical protein